MLAPEKMAAKWETRLTPLFENVVYRSGRNGIIFKLSPLELRELFEIGEKEKMTQQYFKEKVLAPVVKLLRRSYKSLTTTPIEVDGRFLGMQFKVTRHASEGQQRSFRGVWQKNPWRGERFQTTDDIRNCSNPERLKYWYKDNAGFLQGLLCLYDDGLRAVIVAQQIAIKRQLSVLGIP